MQNIVDGQHANTPPGVSLYAAMLYFAEGQLDEAEAIADQVAAQRPDNLIALNLQAALAIARGNYAQAHEQLADLLRKNPTFRPARYNLAKLYAFEGRYREANNELARFIAEDPNNTQALLDSARLALRTNDNRTAIQLYEKIRTIDANALIPSVELVNLYLKTGRPADAMKVAVSINRALPNIALTHETLARVQLARNEREDAQVTLRKAAVLAGYDPRRLMNTARLQKAAGAYQDAENTFSKLLAEKPEAHAARGELAEILFRRGNVEGAKQELSRVLDDDPENVFALALLGDIQLAKGEYSKAAETYTRALRHSNRPELVVSLFRARTLTGEGDAALIDLKTWDDNNPGSVPVTRALAESLHQQGDIAQAQRYYQRLIALNPRDALAHNNLANLLADIDSEQAFRSAQRAYELNSSNPAILDTFGWSLVQVGDLEKGLAYLRDAVARNGRSADMRYHLGVALEEYGRIGEARRQLTRALEMSNKAAWESDVKRRLERLGQ